VFQIWEYQGDETYGFFPQKKEGLVFADGSDVPDTLTDVDFVDELGRDEATLNATVGKKPGVTFKEVGRALDKPIVRVLVSSEAAISTLMQAVAIEDANLTPGVDANTESKPTRDISMEEFLGATLQ
jgi:hypothetical protein